MLKEVDDIQGEPFVDFMFYVSDLQRRTIRFLISTFGIGFTLIVLYKFVSIRYKKD